MKQEFNGPTNGGVAGRDIINEAPAVAISISSISGGHNVFGHTGDIHIHAERVVHKPKVVIQPGPEHITDEQRAKLKSLVDEVVKLESAVRKAPKAHAQVWGALNRKLKTTSYHLIKAADFEFAEKTLRGWIGRLSSSKSAPKKDPDWRKRKYAFIHTNVKQLVADERLATHLVAHYQVRSLKDLDDEQLAAVYQAVAGWKRGKPVRRVVSEPPGEA